MEATTSTWQVRSLRLALHIERTMPCLRRTFCCSGHVQMTHNEDLGGRWMMSSGDSVGGTAAVVAGAVRGKEESIDELLKVVQRLDNKLDHLQSTYVDLYRQVETIVRRDNPATQHRFYNAVTTMLRKRPTSATGRTAPSFRPRKL